MIMRFTFTTIRAYKRRKIEEGLDLEIEMAGNQDPENLKKSNRTIDENYKRSNKTIDNEAATGIESNVGSGDGLEGEIQVEVTSIHGDRVDSSQKMLTEENDVTYSRGSETGENSARDIPVF